MENTIGISKNRLMKEIKAGFEFAANATGIVTQIEDVLALSLITNERSRTKKTGAFRPVEMTALKNSLHISYPDMSKSALNMMKRSIDSYLENLNDKHTYSEEQLDELDLDVWPMAVFNQMYREEKFDLLLSTSNATKTRQ